MMELGNGDWWSVLVWDGFGRLGWGLGGIWNGLKNEKGC